MTRLTGAATSLVGVARRADTLVGNSSIQFSSKLTYRISVPGTRKACFAVLSLSEFHSDGFTGTTDPLGIDLVSATEFSVFDRCGIYSMSSISMER